MPPRLADRLSAARHRRFVGRAEELTLFDSALAAPEIPFCLLHLFGPGGVGKTSLLSEFIRRAEARGLTVLALDARDIEPAPDAFLGALRRAMEAAPETSPLAALHAGGRRTVLLVDTYELLEPLDGWIRQTFLPQLPAETLVVLAGRRPPSAGYRDDSSWQDLLRAVSLRNLSPEESRAYLTDRAVPDDQHAAILDFTHGHPLAVSLVADVFAQRGDIRFAPETAPDVIHALLERFVDRSPSATHRAALETCALVRLTTEALLAETLDLPDVHDLFAWLRDLSFIESGSHGLFPHDLAREILAADLRWRNPDRYAEMHQRARAYYTRRLAQTGEQEQQRVLFDYIFLHRDNAVVRPFFEWQETSAVFADTLRDSDLPALIRMVAQHEGEESARTAERWLARQPQGALVFRDAASGASSADPAGFLLVVALHQAAKEDIEADPGARAAAAFLRQSAPLRPGEGAALFRFWMARETYQAVSAVQSLIFVNTVRQYLTTPGLAYTFFPCADPQFWGPIFTYTESHHLPAADFTIGGRRYGVYGRDWRSLPPTAWLSLLAEKEVAGGQPVAPPPENQTVLVLSQADFTRAGRDALRHYARPDTLGASPLLRSRMVIDRSADSDQITALRKLIVETVESLQATPQQAKLYRALYHTYLHPAPTQGAAAERLDLPFSTYRRHLVAGIEAVTDLLWRQETGGV